MGAVSEMPEISMDQMLSMYHKDDDIPINEQNHELYPQHPFRWCLVGSSGSGKTTSVVHAIINSKLKFDKLLLFAKHLDDPAWEIVIKYLNTIATESDVPLEEILQLANKPEDIPNLSDLDSEEQKLVVFDDFLNERLLNQKTIREYFTSGRHANCSTIYIAQGFFQIPQIIRDNTNYFSLFKIGNHQLMREVSLELSLDVSSKEFINIWKSAVKDRYSFLFVDQKTKDDRLKLRKNFHEVLRTDA